METAEFSPGPDRLNHGRHSALFPARGAPPIFPVVHHPVLSPSTLWLAAVVGLAVGFASAGLTVSVYFFEDRFILGYEKSHQEEHYRERSSLLQKVFKLALRRKAGNRVGA